MARGRLAQPGPSSARPVAPLAPAVAPPGSAVRRFAGPLPAAGGAARPLPKAMAPLGGPLGGPLGVQMWKGLSNAPWMHKNGRWDSVTAGGRLTQVDAKNLELKGGHAIGNSRNPATVAPNSWNDLKALGVTHPGHPPNYVRMHMLNGRIGGPGNTVDNLAPGSNKLNGLHYRKFEKTVINSLKAGDLIDTFRMTATYNAGGGALVTKKGKDAWNDTLSQLDCEATHTPKGTLAVKPLAKVTINEIAGLDGKKNWLGH